MTRTTSRRWLSPANARLKALRPPRPPEPVDWWSIAEGVGVILFCLTVTAAELGWPG